MVIYSDFSSNVSTFNTNLDNAGTNLTSTITAISAAPTNVTTYRSTLASKVGGIKSYINAASPKLDSVIAYNKSFPITYPQFAAYVASVSSITSILNDPNTLMIVNQTSISNTIKNNLGQYTSMIIAGKYNPTNLDYSKLTSLQNLRMYDGNMDDALRTAVQDLVKGTRVLRYLEVPKWGSTIAASAFIGASNNMNTTLQRLVGFEDVTTVGNEAFHFCAGLTSLSFPKVTVFGNQAVRFCTSLISLHLPELIDGGHEFCSECYSLTSVYLPKLTTLGDWAFWRCDSLTDKYTPLLQ
jgi:hypothetical protein